MFATTHDGFLGLPTHFHTDMLAVVAFGLVLVLLVGFGLKAVDRWCWRTLDLEEQVQKGNMAAGIVMGATIIGLCYAVAQVISGIIG